MRTSEASKSGSRAKRIAGVLGVPSRSDLGEGRVGIAQLDRCDVRTPRGQRGRHVRTEWERKPGTTRGSPRRSRTAKASRISRPAVKSRCAREWGGWGRLSEDGPGQHNPDPSEGPWGGGRPTLHGGASAGQRPGAVRDNRPDPEVHEGRRQTGRQQAHVGSRLKPLTSGKAPPDRPAFQPYWGKPAVRNERGDRGNVGIIRSPVRASILPNYWEYTGTSLSEFNKAAEKLSPAETYARVKQLDMQKGLVWLSPSRVNNTYALAMRRADALERRIATISDLAATVLRGELLTFASGAEFYDRSDGLGPLQQAYGFQFGRERVVRLESDRVYQVLRDLKLIDVGMVFATDGRIAAYDLLVLNDDKGFFPNYAMAPVVRKQSLERHPSLAVYLGRLRLGDSKNPWIVPRWAKMGQFQSAHRPTRRLLCR